MKDILEMLKPEIEFIEFDASDVITTSLPFDPDEPVGPGGDDPIVDPTDPKYMTGGGDNTDTGYKIARGFGFGGLIQ